MSSDDLAGIHARLDTIIGRLNEMREECARRGERGAWVAAELVEIKATVYGNGNPGLKTRVDRLETERCVERRRVGLWIGVAGVFSAFLAVLLEWVLPGR